MDPRACGCKGVMPRSKTVTIHDSLPLQRSSGEECSDSLVSLTRSLACSVGRASDLHAEGRGFEFYIG